MTGKVAVTRRSRRYVSGFSAEFSGAAVASLPQDLGTISDLSRSHAESMPNLSVGVLNRTLSTTNSERMCSGMGQYFVAVNHTKKEFVCPWCVGGVAKLVEWMLNPQSAILPYLLRRSDGSGGGDIEDPSAVDYAGRWAGDNVELLGDYHGDGSSYRQVYETYTNISADVVAEMLAALSIGETGLETGLCGTCEQAAPVAATAT